MKNIFYVNNGHHIVAFQISDSGLNLALYILQIMSFRIQVMSEQRLVEF